MNPDLLSRQWDIYPKGGNSDYSSVNPNNFCPVFSQEQLSASLRATELLTPALKATVIMDTEQLHSDILSALPSNPAYLSFLKDLNPCWLINDTGYLLHNGRIYVPDTSDLRL